MTLALIITALLAIVLAVLWQREVVRTKATRRELDTLRNVTQAGQDRLRHLELEATTHRLNPHLFKNTLNTVQSFAYRTNWALERLGRLFDFMLYDSQTGAVSLEEELAFLKDLIELNKLRLGPLYDLRIRIDVPPDDRWYRERVIAPLVTAPFLENAFKHGDLDGDHGFIHIEIHLMDGRLHYEVHNRMRSDGGLVTPRGGIGRHALAQRMQALYPGHHELHYEDHGGGFRATMTIDLEAAHAQMHPAR